MTPSPCAGPPKVPRWFGSAPSATSARIAPTRPFAAAQVERRPAVRIRVDARAELDEQRERVDAVGLRRPDERLVEHLLWIVRRLPRREAAVRAVEAAVRARRGRTRELADQLEIAEPRGDAKVARLAPEQVDDLAVPPEERRDERRAAVAARREVGAAARLRASAPRAPRAFE